jgi:hypothetical protein
MVRVTAQEWMTISVTFLSTPSLGITEVPEPEREEGVDAFNSLSRDHQLFK